MKILNFGDQLSKIQKICLDNCFNNLEMKLKIQNKNYQK